MLTKEAEELETDRSVAFQLKLLANLIHREACKPMDSPAWEGITGVQGWVLAYLYESRDRAVYQRDVERHFSIRRSTAARMLKRMEQNGWIIRRPVAQDGRLKQLCLTDQALEMRQCMRQRIEQVDRKLEAALTIQEREELFRLLEKARQPFLSEGSSSLDGK